jgi:hypothetical protein
VASTRPKGKGGRCRRRPGEELQPNAPGSDECLNRKLRNPNIFDTL